MDMPGLAPGAQQQALQTTVARGGGASHAHSSASAGRPPLVGASQPQAAPNWGCEAFTRGNPAVVHATWAVKMYSLPAVAAQPTAAYMSRPSRRHWLPAPQSAPAQGQGQRAAAALAPSQRPPCMARLQRARRRCAGDSAQAGLRLAAVNWRASFSPPQGARVRLEACQFVTADSDTQASNS